MSSAHPDNSLAETPGRSGTVTASSGLCTEGHAPGLKARGSGQTLALAGRALDAGFAGRAGLLSSVAHLSLLAKGGRLLSREGW